MTTWSEIVLSGSLNISVKFHEIELVLFEKSRNERNEQKPTNQQTRVIKVRFSRVKVV